LLRPDPPAQIYQLTGNTMGTSYRILVTEFPESLSENDLAEHIQQDLYRIDRELMSIYADDSELSRFNSSPANIVFPVSPELAGVVQLALEISELTEGYFDISVGPLVELWGFGASQLTTFNVRQTPDEERLETVLQLVDYTQLQVLMNPPALLKTSDIQLDLGGIAKGYGVDVVADYLDSLGMQSYFIEVGGELRIKGRRPDGSSWVPAIETPVDSAPQAYRIFYTQGESIAVAGSGDYRNYFEQNGVRYSHEIDPFTGFPITHNLAAVTVITDTAARADALSTAFMVMGADKAFELAEQLDLAAYFISKSAEHDGFEDRYTSRFAYYLEERP